MSPINGPICLIISVTEKGIVASKILLPNNGGNVTRKSIHEYAQAVRKRYEKASKTEKGQILDEFCQNTGYNRKSAIRLFRSKATTAKTQQGRPRQYGLAVVPGVKKLWEACNKICSKRLAPFIPKLLPILEQHGEIDLSPEIRAKLLKLSPATIDRLLEPYRQRGLRQPYSQSQSATSLKAIVPVRTFGEWKDVKPGSMQIDLVVHCGESPEGFYLTTLNAVDVATGWTECEIVWGKGQQRVGTGLHHIRQRLPVGLREFHSDNGGEFLNELIYQWSRREGLGFSRGRRYKKNDQAYVEQKNWSVVRRTVGYDRYSSKAAYEQFKRVYGLNNLYVNFFQPIRKVVGKERSGAKVKKSYDEAQTPYERMLAAEVLTAEKRTEMERLFRTLNPVKLRAEIDEELASLWKMADRKVPVVTPLRQETKRTSRG